MKRAIAILLALALAGVARAESATPPTLSDIRVDQHVGATLPLDATFRDESGGAVTLGDVTRGRPAVVALVYFGCPMLCTTTLNQLMRSLSVLKASAGESFDVVAISIDPRETPSLAADKKRTYIRAYRRDAASGWHFLTADQSSIDAVTKAAGFRYRWDEPTQTFVHPAATMIVTPDGRISRYFLGVDFPPTELQSAIEAAGRSTIGRPVEKVYFYCVRYDPETGKYGLLIGRLLRGLAVTSVVSIVGLIAGLQFVAARRAAGGAA